MYHLVSPHIFCAFMQCLSQTNKAKLISTLILAVHTYTTILFINVSSNLRVGSAMRRFPELFDGSTSVIPCVHAADAFLARIVVGRKCVNACATCATERGRCACTTCPPI